MRDLTIRDGAAREGGGIYSDRGADDSTDLTIINCTIIGNSGGDVWAEGGVTVINSTIANSDRNAIRAGTLHMTNSVVSGSGDATVGGGIYVATANVVSTISNSTISGNGTGGFGGGIYAPKLVVKNSIIAGNSAGSGGGIESGQVTISNTIFVNNSANPGQGGAIDTVFLNLRSDLMANNPSLSIPDMSYARLKSDGYNLVGDGSGARGNIQIDPAWTATDQVGNDTTPLDPRLNTISLVTVADGSSLQLPTLMPSSPAIGHGDCSTTSLYPGLTTDIRGIQRKTTRDIGAFEFTTASNGSLPLGASFPPPAHQ